MSTYVHKLFTAAESSFRASLILSDAENELGQVWGLRIKDTSRMILAPYGAEDVSVCDPLVWPIVTSMSVLGHCVQHDGGADQCVRATIQKMWKSFYANCAYAFCVASATLPLDTMGIWSVQGQVSRYSSTAHVVYHFGHPPT